MKKRINLFSLVNPFVFSLIFSLFISLFVQSKIFSQVSYNMSLIKNIAYPGETSYSALWGYTAPNGREYVILGSHSGTVFYDITDTLNIRQIGFVPTINIADPIGNTWREIKTYSHYAYIVSEVDSSGIQIVDLQYLPDSIKYLGRKLVPGHRRTHTISQNGPYLYLNGGNPEFGQGTTVLDLTVNPENPVARGGWNNLYIHDCTILRDTIYACNIVDDKISIIDARNKDNLLTIKTFPTTPVGMPHNCAVTSDRKYLYSTDEITDGKLKIWDIHDVQDPVLIRRFIPPEFFNNDVIHNVEIYGNYAVIAYYTAGVMVLDISNPANPSLAGFYDTSIPNLRGCWAVYKFPSGKIAASDMDKGLFLLRFNNQQQVPVANFYAGQNPAIVTKPAKFYDFSSGFPTSRTWTVTGPQNFTSNETNPEFTFNTVGTYTVKLRVSNSMGSDSLTKVNYVNVIYPPFSQFSFLMPTSFMVNTTPTDTSKFTFTWSKTGINSFFNYKLKIKSIGGSIEKIIASGNSGRDTVLRIRKSYLDSIGREFGYTNDSVLCSGKVFAYNGADSLPSSNVLIFTIKSNTVGINNISSVIPGEYKLYNNYPNPFNPATKIKFDLKSAGYTTLKIYDISGREILKLFNGMLAAGMYEYEFNAENLSSGIYFYKLESADFSSVKKMSLVK